MAGKSNSWNRVPFRTRQALKAQLLARDGLMCCLCGMKIKSAREATIEHKIPRRLGLVPVTAVEHLGLAHRSCNSSNRFRAGTRQVTDGLDFFAQEPHGHPAPREALSPE